jgi:hypothetical protein
LDNIDAGTITDLRIRNNPDLSTCEVQSICDYLAAPNGSISIYGNAIGCNSQEEVEEACLLVYIEDKSLSENQFNTYPNPTQSILTIEIFNEISDRNYLSIININGQQLISQSITKPKTEIDISYLTTGIYIVKVWNEREVMVTKVIKR